MVSAMISGEWDGEPEEEEFGLQELIMVVLAVAMLVLAVIILLGRDDDEYLSKNANYEPPSLEKQEVLDAIIVPEEDDSDG